MCNFSNYKKTITLIKKIAIRDKSTVLNIRPKNPPTTTTSPDHSTLQSTLQGNLPTKKLSQIATRTKLFGKHNYSLILLALLYDDNCIVTLTKKDLKVIKNNTAIIKGTRSTSGDSLWDIPIPQTTKILTNSIPTKPLSKITYPKPPQKLLNIILQTDK